MESIKTVGLVVAMFASWILTAFFAFKSRQSSGKSFVNDIQTDFGGGSFIDSFFQPIKRFFWEIFWFIFAFISLGLTVAVIARFSTDDKVAPPPAATVIEQKEAPQPSPPSMSETVPPATESTQKTPEKPLEESGTEAPKTKDASSESSSVIAVCDSESGLFAANNCRWKICAEPENKTKEECKNYIRE